MRHQPLKPLTITQQQLDQAYQWLCQQRNHFPANTDIWTLRREWEANKQGLRQQINQGDYVFSPLKTICKKSGHIIHLWSSQDVLVMKVLARHHSASIKIIQVLQAHQRAWWSKAMCRRRTKPTD